MGAERPLGLTQGATPTSRLLNSLTQRHAHLTGAADAGHTAALEQLWNLACSEASTLAYTDAFRAIMVAFILATFPSCAKSSRQNPALRPLTETKYAVRTRTRHEIN